MNTQTISSQNEPVIPDIAHPPDALCEDIELLDGDVCLSAYWSIFQPHDLCFFTLPLFHSLRQRSYHQITLEGPFDIKKLVHDHRQHLYRSDVAHNRHSNPPVERLLLCLGDGIFVLYEHTNLVVFAPTTQAAARVAEGLRSYEKPPTENKPGFRLVSLTPTGAETEFIAMQDGASMDEAEPVLHYGDEFVKWERTWLGRIDARQSGLTLVFGPPGVGKTQWLKSLMMRFSDRFVCYYLPLSSFDVLAAPSFVSFWLDQNRVHSKKAKLAIIEDA